MAVDGILLPCIKIIQYLRGDQVINFQLTLKNSVLIPPSVQSNVYTDLLVHASMPLYVTFCMADGVISSLSNLPDVEMYLNLGELATQLGQASKPHF